MRDRPEILGEAIIKTDKGYLIPESDVKLRLLQLEVLVDIRDVLSSIRYASLAISEHLESLH